MTAFIYMTPVLAFGTFDNFHPGHAAYLQQAASLGGYLTIVVARDVNVYKLKNKLAKQTELIRRKAVADFLQTKKIPGQAVLGLKKDRWGVLKKYQPAVIALGYDQKVDEKALINKTKELSLEVKIKRLSPYQPDKYKSSLI